ncbi:MAG: response regulator [Candidatus Latescibacteria bacterium]|nr:response regulator [Candidatus Latescibacterota bacterium]
MPEQPPHLLLVDDTPANLHILCAFLEGEGYSLAIAQNGEEALDLVQQEQPDLILLDVMMPGMDGFEVCRRLQQNKATRPIPVIFVTAKDLTEGAVEGFATGAVDYITKPFREAEVLARVRTHLRLYQLSRQLAENVRQLAAKNAELAEEIEQRHKLTGRLSMLSEREVEHWGLEGFVGDSPTLKKIIADIRLMQENIAPSVLITGESGTGKELIARAIHFGGQRREGPFIPVNCAALPGELVEALLFGHRKGAFTGADADRSGYFEMAHEGTLFLDEIGEMPLVLQAKLLRVLEDGTVQRLGESHGRPVEVRVLAATNADLQQQISQGTFRRDLYFRLARFTVDAPPLRQRPDDIPLLVHHFIRLFSRDMGLEPFEPNPAVLERLRAHPFPGNVRELKNAIERALIESRGEPIQPHHIHLTPADATPAATPPTTPLPAPQLDLPDNLDLAIRQVEGILVHRTLERTGGNIAETARLLGTNRNRIYKVMQETPSPEQE